MRTNEPHQRHSHDRAPLEDSMVWYKERLMAAAASNDSGGQPQPIVVAEPDIDCVGEFTPCDSSCVKYFDITTAASGSGANCDYGFYEAEPCTAGTDECPQQDSLKTSSEIAARNTVTFGVAVSMMWLVQI